MLLSILKKQKCTCKCNAGHQRIIDTLLMLLPVLTITIMSIGMLAKSKSHGGIDFFLNQQLGHYLFFIGLGLTTLVITGIQCTSEKNSSMKFIIEHLKDPLLIFIVFRLLWMIFFESQHVRDFAIHDARLGVEYVVLCSIPLFLSILVLTFFKFKIGYILGGITGIIHVILVSAIVVLGKNPNAFGPIIVITVSGLIAYFCIRRL